MNRATETAPTFLYAVEVKVHDAVESPNLAADAAEWTPEQLQLAIEMGVATITSIEVLRRP